MTQQHIHIVRTHKLRCAECIFHTEHELVECKRGRFCVDIFESFSHPSQVSCSWLICCMMNKPTNEPSFLGLFSTQHCSETFPQWLWKRWSYLKQALGLCFCKRVPPVGRSVDDDKPRVREQRCDFLNVWKQLGRQDEVVLAIRYPMAYR